MKLLQVNTTVNYSAPGRIAEDIGAYAIARGVESYIAYGRSIYNCDRDSASHLIKIDSRLEIWHHVLMTRLLDRHGLASCRATDRLIATIQRLQPDIIHLHNIHGYYLNYERLFAFLASIDTPVVWTIHDTWPYTGHCAFYTLVGCQRWQSGCGNCPIRSKYPTSFVDRSAKNYLQKRRAFSSLSNLTLVAVSDWLKGELHKSFLGDKRIEVIRNGVDVNVFRPDNIVARDEKLVLGVANVWEEHKGLDDFFKLRDALPDDYKIVLVGVDKKLRRSLPDGILGVERTTNVNQLVRYYNTASVFVNPTHGDTLSNTNMEALACGTPVVTYNVGGSPEVLSPETGCVVNERDIRGLREAIIDLQSRPRQALVDACRSRATLHFDAERPKAAYLQLYEELCASGLQ